MSAGLSLTSLTSTIFDQKCVHMNTVLMSITPKAIQDCSMSWKHQSRAVCLLGACCKDPHGSLGDGKRCDSSAGSEDIRCRGRSVGTRSEEILPSPERCNQKSVFLGAPLSRCYHQGGMQRRLSARSSGVVESSRSGGESDSELILNQILRPI